MEFEMFQRVKVKDNLEDKKLLAGDEGVIMEIATAKDGTVGHIVEFSEDQANDVWIETLVADQIKLASDDYISYEKELHTIAEGVILEDSSHPAWLYSALVESILPRKAGIQTSFHQFSEIYSLHDSLWIGLFYDVAYEQTVTLAIWWNAVCLPKELQEIIDIQDVYLVAQWPYLLVRLEGVDLVKTEKYNDMKDTHRTISGCHFEVVSGRKQLTISDVYGGQVKVAYRGQETFLAVKRDGTVLPFSSTPSRD